MKAHWQYLKYVLRHKLYVFQMCRLFGLTWRGLVHDLSKFSPAEWGAYVWTFYGPWKYEDRPKKLVRDFDAAWLHHIHHNPHHWQHYVLLEDSGAVKPLDMPADCIWEMIADWWGAGRAINGKPADEQPWNRFDELKKWYLANRDKMQMHEHTRRRVEYWIGLRPDDWMYQGSVEEGNYQQPPWW